MLSQCIWVRVSSTLQMKVKLTRDAFHGDHLAGLSNLKGGCLAASLRYLCRSRSSLVPSSTGPSVVNLCDLHLLHVLLASQQGVFHCLLGNECLRLITVTRMPLYVRQILLDLGELCVLALPVDRQRLGYPL